MRATPRVVLPVPLIVSGLALVLLSSGLGAWVYLAGNDAFAVDDWWNTLLVGSWAPFGVGFAHVMDFLGGGWFGVFVVPIGGTIVLAVMRRPWSATYFLVAQAISAALVQFLKHTFGRARPAEIAVLSDYGSYPSGHVANAATLATIAIVLVPRLWIILVGVAWVFLMAFSRTYIHAHWLSDTAGGALIGAGAALVLAGALARPLNRELALRR